MVAWYGVVGHHRGGAMHVNGYARKYRDPLPVLTISPELILPCVMGLVVTFWPSVKLGEPRMLPVMVPSPFLRQLLMVGTPRGAVRTGDLAGAAGAGRDWTLGADSVVLAPPPNSEKVARGFAASVGAGLGAGLAFCT